MKELQDQIELTKILKADRDARLRCVIFRHLMVKVPRKHETLTQCCCNVGPSSVTLAQHYNNIWLMSILV